MLPSKKTRLLAFDNGLRECLESRVTKMPDILFIVATKPEWSLLQAWGDWSRDAHVKYPLYSSIINEKRVHLLQTGIGPERAQEALASFLASHPAPSSIVNFGLCGALDPSLACGDVVVAARLTRDNHDSIAANTELTALFLTIAKDCGVPFRNASHLTTSVVLETPQAKTHAFQTTACASVDMEAHALATIATQKNIAFCALKSVFDEVSDDLEGMFGPHTLTSEGDVNVGGVAMGLLKKPKLVMSLPGFQKKAAKAGKNLAILLEAALDTQRL